MTANERKPALRGVLQDDDKDFRNRKTLGKIALWENESDNANAPKFRGVLEIPSKGKFRITLWDKEIEEDSSSPFSFSKPPDFFCRYCRRKLSNDVLWDACNRCAIEKEGLQL